jgi:hypothetical protein
MKGLKKIALATTIAAVSTGALAELKALDDSAMGELTGQAGLTIDIETKWSIGEFAYVDAGVVVLKDLAMGGNSTDLAFGQVAGEANDMLDNVRLTLDVAGAGGAGGVGTPGDNIGAYGMSEVKGLALVHDTMLGAGTNADFAAAAAGANFFVTGQVSRDGAGGLAIDNEKVAGDGDLMLHFGFTDAWQKVGGFGAYSQGAGTDFYTGDAKTFANTSYADARDFASKAVDFQFDIGQIALADSGYADVQDNGSSTRLGNEAIQKTNHTTGADTDQGTSTTTQTTTLISDFSMKGYLGPMDIRIQNKGNGFGAGAGYGAADSKIEWDSFFKVTDLDLYIDIAGVQLTDIQIHNERGDLTSLNTVSYDDGTGVIVTENTSALGFAHSKRDIFAVKDAVFSREELISSSFTSAYVDGIAINTEFKGDIDIGALSFGDTGVSIGSIHLTDIESTTNWTISAH